MKKLITVLMTAFMVSILTGCGSDKIQGVNVRDSGEVTVTFTVPEGMSVEEVLGSEIGTETAANITSITTTGTSNNGFCYWCKVSSGGILCRKGDVYRYGPDAEVSRLTGAWSPPAWVMLTSTPSKDEIFDPDDAQKLEEKYGIKLNFSQE